MALSDLTMVDELGENESVQQHRKKTPQMDSAYELCETVLLPLVFSQTTANE